MNFFKKNELKVINKFLRNGYYVGKVEDKKSLIFITNLIKKNIITKKKIRRFNLNLFHKFKKIQDLNKTRVKILNSLNQNKFIRSKYFNLARNHLYTLVGNELMMQKRLNLSIQLPKDSSSLLPIHSDVWSGDSPYEINLWVPLVNCYKTKSMYILNQKQLSFFLKKTKNKKIKSSTEIYNVIKNKVEWINIKYGEFLIFNQTLPHGNIVNLEDETRWSLNCRFKNIFSPYEDKKIGEFFTPITTRPMTKIGINYKYPLA